MIRTQIRLDEEQARRLKLLAVTRGVSVAELIRQAAGQLLQEADNESKWERASRIIGKFRDVENRADVAENHDRYLEEAYLDWRS